jgi:hypothetical protein
MFGGYGAYGGYGGMNSELRSDMWIQQHVPGGLNSEYYHRKYQGFFLFLFRRFW